MAVIGRTLPFAVDRRGRLDHVAHDLGGPSAPGRLGPSPFAESIASASSTSPSTRSLKTSRVCTSSDHRLGHLRIGRDLARRQGRAGTGPAPSARSGPASSSPSAPPRPGRSSSAARSAADRTQPIRTSSIADPHMTAPRRRPIGPCTAATRTSIIPASLPRHPGLAPPGPDPAATLCKVCPMASILPGHGPPPCTAGQHRHFRRASPSLDARTRKIVTDARARRH